MEPCDHEWKLVEHESWSSSYENHVSCYWECQICGETKEAEPHDFYDEE